MKELISLDQYFDKIGKELFPDNWSKETVYYFSERKKELKHLRDHALETYKVASNRIWGDGIVKVSLRLEQGYIEPPFAIEQFYFAQSGCISKEGFHSCKLELNKGGKGRPREYDLDDIIREYVRKNHTIPKIPTRNISADAVIRFVEEFLEKQKMKVPSKNTIRGHLHKLHPECKKASRNSKK